jgi:23S rRNA (cytosine1962-C5)-methyltransferase
MTTSNNLPQVVLTQPLEPAVRRGHPWLYADAVSLRGQRGVVLEPGEVVDVVNRDGDWIARGVVDPGSPILVRVWTTDPTVSVDDQLLESRIKQARRRRSQHLDSSTTGYRLLHGEGDRIPGLVCDLYGDVGVLRPDGKAAERWIAPARRVIERMTGIKRWVVRRAEIHRGDHEVTEWLAGEGDPIASFTEHHALMTCDVISGQKTGFFLDQRDNRARIARLSRGKRLLNLFGYTGGFSVMAALQGAAHTTTVDLAGPAIAMAEGHFRANGLNPNDHTFVVADVFDYLETLQPQRAPFEIAVCDPPSFAHKRKDVERAQAAYIRLFAALLRVMPSQSIVALCSCSSHISRAMFLEIVADAAAEAACSLVLTGIHGAGEDHPVLPGFPEGDYLQCVIGTISRE